MAAKKPPARKAPAKRPARTAKPQPLRVDLACGQHVREGFQGADIWPGEGVEWVLDLENDPWPWADNSVDELHASHYIEHVRDLLKFMDNAWRVLKDEGSFTIISPYYTSIRAWQDPTHVRAISENTWPYFSRDWRKEQGLDHYPVECDFEVETLTAAYNPPWHLKSEEARLFATQHYFNVISDITVILKARK
jgi:predicted SAM-dependent methyltransferase